MTGQGKRGSRSVHCDHHLARRQGLGGGGGGGELCIMQTSQLSLFWYETQAFGPNLTLSLQNLTLPGLKLAIWLFNLV